MNNNDLFIQPPQFEKVAYKQVSETPSDWTGNVMESFYNQFPFFANAKVAINFSQKDETKGYAIGAITVEEGGGMTIPIIIKGRELYPFDVAIVNGNTMPLTNSTIQMYVENRGAFWKLVKPDEGDVTNALFNTSFSQSITPTYMHETYKQASKGEQTFAIAEKPADIKPEKLEKVYGDIYKNKDTDSFNDMYMAIKGKHYKIVGNIKKADYDPESLGEQQLRNRLKETLANEVSGNPAPLDNVLSSVAKTKVSLPADATLKTMEEQALMGGQMKANEIFMQMKKDHAIRRSDSLMYMLLAFKKWAAEQGIRTSGWDIPGFEKTSGVTDYFFPEDVNFLAKQTGISHSKLADTKKKDPQRFAVLHETAKKAMLHGGDVRAALAIRMSAGSGPEQMSDRTQTEAGKLDSNPEPALGVTPFSKKGEKDEKESKDKKDKKKESKDKEKEEHEKDSSLIDKISSTITQEMKDRFFEHLQKDASIVEGFKANGSAGLILKIAAINPQELNFTDKVRNELERDIHYIYKSGSHEYTGIFGNSKVNDPVRITLDEDAAQKFEPIKTASLSVAEQLEKNGAAPCYFKTNTGRSYAILENGDYCELPLEKMATVSDALNKVTIAGQFKHGEPELTKSAAWVVNGQFTDPFEVTNIWNVDDKEFIEAFTGLEKRSYRRLKGIDGTYVERGITYIPESSMFVKFGELVNIPEKIIDNPWLNNRITKTADNQYVLEGNVFKEVLKKEGAIHDLHNAIWSMVQVGVRKEDIEKVASMQTGDILSLRYELRMPHTLEKIASIMEKDYTRDADSIVELARSFIKEAAVFNNPETVDTVLSLNFVNKNNIMEFVNSLPMFAQVTQKLADMLLKARLGVTLIEEGALRRTMLGLVEIMDVLNGIQNLLEKK